MLNPSDWSVILWSSGEWIGRRIRAPAVGGVQRLPSGDESLPASLCVSVCRQAATLRLNTTSVLQVWERGWDENL